MALQEAGSSLLIPVNWPAQIGVNLNEATANHRNEIPIAKIPVHSGTEKITARFSFLWISNSQQKSIKGPSFENYEQAIKCLPPSWGTQGPWAEPPPRKGVNSKGIVLSKKPKLTTKSQFQKYHAVWHLTKMILI